MNRYDSREMLCQEIADLASLYVERTGTLSRSPIAIDVDSIQIWAQDDLTSEADAHGYWQRTTRSLRIHSGAVRLEALKIIQGFDKYDGGSYADSHVEILAEPSWRLVEIIGKEAELVEIRDRMGPLVQTVQPAQGG